jgi:hypothetical protein
MSRLRSAVRNAADPEQVKRARRAEKRIDERFQDSLRAVMSTTDGRLVVWSYLGKFGVYRGVYADNPQRMAYDAGRQQCGHDLLADVIAADEHLYQVMEREMRALADAEAATEQAESQAQTDEMMQ